MLWEYEVYFRTFWEMEWCRFFIDKLPCLPPPTGTSRCALQFLGWQQAVNEVLGQIGHTRPGLSQVTVLIYEDLLVQLGAFVILKEHNATEQKMWPVTPSTHMSTESV